MNSMEQKVIYQGKAVYTPTKWKHAVSRLYLIEEKLSSHATIVVDFFLLFYFSECYCWCSHSDGEHSIGWKEDIFGVLERYILVNTRDGKSYVLVVHKRDAW